LGSKTSGDSALLASGGIGDVRSIVFNEVIHRSIVWGEGVDRSIISMLTDDAVVVVVAAAIDVVGERRSIIVCSFSMCGSTKP
jgi:hypothetical protein